MVVVNYKRQHPSYFSALAGEPATYIYLAGQAENQIASLFIFLGFLVHEVVTLGTSLPLAAFL